MQFQVPQFIEVEDKIFGPLTFKQFIYVAGGAGAAYLFWRVLPFFISVPLILAVGGFAAALAFFKFNDRPFIIAVEHAFFYFIKAKLYLWSNQSKSKKPLVSQEKPQIASSQVYIPKLSESKLHELAWSLDIKERIASGTASSADRDAAIRPEDSIIAPIRTSREARI